MNLARRRPWTNAVWTEALRTRTLERRRASIRVKKPRLAAFNLKNKHQAATAGPRHRVRQMLSARHIAPGQVLVAGRLMIAAFRNRCAAGASLGPRHLVHP